MSKEAEKQRRLLAVKELRRIRRITQKLSEIYPELAMTFDLQQGLYERSVAAAIMMKAGQSDAVRRF
ncbi:UNVERIFIED_ORG: hypothetical protein ABID57_000655 [Arthrobacter sp. UYEF1]